MRKAAPSAGAMQEALGTGEAKGRIRFGASPLGQYLSASASMKGGYISTLLTINGARWRSIPRVGV